MLRYAFSSFQSNSKSADVRNLVNDSLLIHAAELSHLKLYLRPLIDLIGHDIIWGQCAVFCRPNIIHAHDWQSAPVVFGDVHPSKSIFTIHNMEFGVDQIGRAVAASSVSTTVSPTYATEVSAVTDRGCPTIRKSNHSLWCSMPISIWSIPLINETSSEDLL